MSTTHTAKCYEYFGLDDPQIQKVEDLLSLMDVPQMVGQLFTAYMMPERYTVNQQLQEYSNRLQDEVAKYHLGGYYLNRYYLPTTAHLIQMLQEQSKIPLFIGADMENGAGSGFGGVIAQGLSHFPAFMAVGATGSPQYAYQMGFWTAAQARLIGVNYIFSPSLDINNDPANPIINVRSFGEDPHLVGMLGEAYIQGIQDGMVVPCAKHFPGHGNTSEDTHLKLCKIHVGKDELQEMELSPFQRAIDHTQIESIMTAHIHLPALDKEVVPATFSSNILTNLLRNEMEFEGVIITDAMLMKAVTEICGPGEAAVRAIQAGADIVLMPPDLPEAYKGVMQAVENKEISMDRLQESVTRILAMKEAFAILEPIGELPLPIPKPLINKADEISFNICCDAVTLVKNDGRCIPILPTDDAGLIFLQDKRSEEQFSADYLNDLAIVVPSEPDQNLREQVDEYMQQSDIIVFMADIQVLPEKDSIHVPPAHESIIHKAIQAEKPVILVSFGNPYLLNAFPDVDAYLCAYRFTEQMFDAVTEVISGERIPHGRLPVSLNEEYPAGHGYSF